MKQTTQLEAGLKMASMAALGVGPVLGAMGGYRNAGDTPEEKIEGLGLGALRGGATTTGAALGGMAGLGAGSLGDASPQMTLLLAALGVLGGGAAGYAGSGALMGPSTSDKKRDKPSPPPSVLPDDEF